MSPPHFSHKTVVNSNKVFNQQEGQSQSKTLRHGKTKDDRQARLQTHELGPFPQTRLCIILNVIINLRECVSGKLCACCVTMIAHWRLILAHCFFFFFFFVLFCFLRTVFKDYSLLLASFFSKLMLPYWFHRLMNVKHQKLASLIMAGKGFKNSGICASEQRLYQQVPVAASWKKKMVLIKNQHTWFPKGHLPGTWTLRFIKFLS